MYQVKNGRCDNCSTVTTAAPCTGSANCNRTVNVQANAAFTATPVCNRCGRYPCGCQNSVYAPVAAAPNCPITREEKLLRVQQLGFMTDDLRLFLNTHAGCEEALQALQYYMALEKTEKEEFEKLYGSLTLEAMDGRCQYDWIACPWPWHVEV